MVSNLRHDAGKIFGDNQNAVLQQTECCQSIMGQHTASSKEGASYHRLHSSLKLIFYRVEEG
jgi:hypothetical protein